MLYYQYRLDINEKRAILNSRDKSVKCIDLNTGDETQLTPSEEAIIVCHLMTLELYERKGIDVGDYLSINPDYPVERAEHVICEIQRIYNISPPTLEKRVKCTKLPEDWQYLDEEGFSHLMHQWIDGKI